MKFNGIERDIKVGFENSLGRIAYRQPNGDYFLVEQDQVIPKAFIESDPDWRRFQSEHETNAWEHFEPCLPDTLSDDELERIKYHFIFSYQFTEPR